MRGRCLSAPLAVVMFLMVTVCAAADQEVVASKGVNNIPTSARLAFDPLSGNIVVAMTELKPTDIGYGRVYAVVLKLLASGNYKAKKVQMLSPASGWHGRAYVVYVAQKKMFLVAWDTGDPSAPSAPAKILARWVNRKTGKPKGDAFELVGDDRRNLSPVLIPLNRVFAGSPGSRPSGGSHYSDYDLLMVHTSYQTPETALSPKLNFGLRLTAHFSVGDGFDMDRDDQLDPLREEKGYQLSKAIEFGWGSRINYAGYEQYGVALFLRGYDTVYNGDIRTTVGFANSYLLNSEIKQSGETTFGFNTITPRKAPLGFNQDMGGVADAAIYIYTTAEDGMYKRNFVDMHPNNGNGHFLSIDKNPFGGKAIDHSDMIGNIRTTFNFAPPGESSPPAKPVLVWQISSAEDGWVYKRKIVKSPKGKPKTAGGMVKLFEHGGTLQALIADRIHITGGAPPAAKYNAVVVWQKKLSEAKHELRAHLFKVK